MGSAALTETGRHLAGLDHPDSAAAVASALNDPETAYRVAFDFQGADLEVLESTILMSQDIRIIYDFAIVKGERGGDVTRLQERVIESNDGGIMVLFAVDVPGADIERIEEVLRSHSDPKFLRLLDAEKRDHGIE